MTIPGARRRVAGGERPSGTPRQLVAAWWLTGLAVLLGTAAAAAGLWLDAAYRDPPASTAAYRGNDLATLVVGLPLLGLALAGAVRGSTRGQLVWVGMLGYAVYNYAYYVFGAAFNPLFLVHVAAFVLAAAALGLALAGLDAPALAARFRPGTPARWVAGLLLLLAVGIAAMWSFQSVRFAVTGQVPVDVLPLPPDRVHLGYALDLALFAPVVGLAGVLLWRRTAWGYLLGTAACVFVGVFQVNYLGQRLFVSDLPGTGLPWVEPADLLVLAVPLAAAGVMLASVRPARRLTRAG